MKNTEKRVIEIRAAEGGKDARLFVAELAQAYIRLANREGWMHRADGPPNSRSGHQSFVIVIEGGSLRKLEHEAGAQRLQRVPPTERKGRVHSSTVTVSVLGASFAQEQTKPYQSRRPSDYRLEWYNGTVKAGGQHHQKNATCCRLTHLPSGIMRTAQTRSRKNSQQLALQALSAELDRLTAEETSKAKNGVRKAQVGNGERSGVKTRTWRFQDDTVIDYATGKKARASDVISGRFDLLWP